jgi:hypothetical protein
LIADYQQANRSQGITLRQEGYADGYWWTYQTYKRMEWELHGLFSIHTIKKSLKALSDDGLLIRANHNEYNPSLAYGKLRTTWYRMTDEAMKILKPEWIPVDKRITNILPTDIKYPSDEYQIPYSKDTSKETSKDNIKTIVERQAFFEETVRNVWSKLPDDKKLSQDELINFIDYWNEIGENDKKTRKEKEKTFGIAARIGTWRRNNFNGVAKNSYGGNTKTPINALSREQNNHSKFGDFG